MEKPLSKRRQQGLRSSEKILDSAQALIARQGFAGTSISALIKESGVPASSIYYFFGSKDGLVAAVMQRGAARWFDAAPRWGDIAGRDVRRRFERFFGAIAESTAAQPEFQRLVVLLALERGEVDEAVLEALRNVRAEALGRLEEPIVALLQDAGVKQPRRHAGQLARMTLAVGDGLLIAARVDGTPDEIGRAFAALAQMLIARAEQLAA
jgi:AcrR family transcriptional regulator